MARPRLTPGVGVMYSTPKDVYKRQGVDSMFDIVWSRGADGVTFTYGDVYLENERQYSCLLYTSRCV